MPCRHAEELKGYLVNRAYDEKIARQRIDKATRVDRDSLFTPHQKVNKQTVPLVISFHPDLPNLMCILHDYQCVILTSALLKEILPNPLLVAYRRPPPNLKDVLVRAAFGQVEETYTGNSRCQQPCCKTFTHIKEGITLRSTTTNEIFRVKATANCCTKNVVYVKCSIQYVRET